MPKYDFFEVRWTNSSVSLVCTDHTEMEMVADEVKEMIPSAKKEVRKSLPSGEPYEVWLSKLDGKDWSTSWWVVRYLSQKGWEPWMMHNCYVSGDDPPYFCFIIRR